jgi:hypothetical protein
MLYSKNGLYPEPLPFRIVMPNGTTRTDPATFTQEEITSAGYFVAPDPPSKGPYQTLAWTGTNWVLQETRTLEIAKSMRLEDLSAYRRYKETKFTFNGIEIYLDQQTQARINAAVAGFAYRPNDIITWEVTRGNFIQFDKPTMEAIAVAAWTHIKLCFENVKRITDLVQAATTIEEVDFISLETGWPDEIPPEEPSE